MKETVEFSELVGKALDGDNDAFEELYRLTNKTAYSTAYLLLKNQSDVEDVLQNVYLKAFRNLSELKNPESFEGWIKTIVENESKNYIKKEKRIHAPIVFIKNKSIDYSEEWNQPIPQEFMEREELRKSVNDVLDKLSPEIRACIVLFHYEDKSLNEISEILDLPLGTVKSRLHNGRKQIEKEFNKLRKKDPTLYGIAAIPALLSFLAFQTENIAVPAAISEAVLSAASVGATAVSAAGAGAVSAGGAAATGAASATAAATGASTATGAAATAVTSIAVKVTAVAVAGSVAVGGGVAVKNHVENKASETTSAYTSAVIQEETCTVSQTEMTLTEILTTVISESTTELITTKTSTAADKSQTSATSTTVSEESTTNAKQTTTRRTTTKKATTTAKETTTAAVTTTKPTTTQEVTTTKPTTTKKETTTVKPTTKPTTTAAPTTNPENNYGASGGVITEYTGSESNVSIPAKIGSDSVTAIGAGAFAGNTSVKSVSLPSSVTQIGQEAFADCSSLSSVSLPSSLELIGIGAFYGCSNLSSVTVPNGTKTIDDEAFAECTSLGTITIPESVTNISDSAFDGCDSLTIRCAEGSQAHNYALANSINYTLI